MQSPNIKKYKGWDLLETMPLGWSIDLTVGSPVHGYNFITNGKSVIAGQKRALLISSDRQKKLQFEYSNKLNEKLFIKIEKPKQIIDENYKKTVNELARGKFKEKMLNEILVDLMVCEIEGWSKHEYIEELKNLINLIGKQK